jgi:glycosyltransferase involved in cell wall biosynthesis
MSATATRSRGATESAPDLAVVGVRNPRSYGVARYAARLGEALREERVSYRLEERPPRAGRVHFHLANSSRRFLAGAHGHPSAFVVTVHDVVPRKRSLLPLYRLLAYPRLARSAAVVVHTRFAADMLRREMGTVPARLEVIPFPAQQPRRADRSEARRALAWPEDALIAVVPGVIKSVKLAREALEASSGSPNWRVALVGSLGDRDVAKAARAAGALVLAEPRDDDYERAIVASDCVLCLRSGSVGETNAPLLEALGAGRAVLATPTGSIPEVAGDSVLYCDGTPGGIRSGLADLSHSSLRAELERAASARAAGLTWRASARTHASLFREVFA